MEARFKHVQGPAPLPDKTPVSRVASADPTARVGSPAASRVSRIAPPSSPAPRQPPSRGESPEKPAQASPVKASMSPRPSSGSATPVRGIPRFGAPASRPLSMMQPRQSTSSSSQLPPPVLEAELAPAPVAKPRTGQLFAPLPSRPTGQESSSGADGAHDAVQAIRSILSSDPSRSVDGLKRVQRLLETQHDCFQGSVDDLVQALVKQIRLVFDTPAHLSEPPWFRLAKHLIQTLNNFCDHAELLKEVDEKDMEELLFELTSRLLQTDDATGGLSPSPPLARARSTVSADLACTCVSRSLRRQGAVALPQHDHPADLQRRQARDHLQVRTGWPYFRLALPGR